MTRPRPNAGYRDGKTIRRWATYSKPDIATDDTIIQEELNPRPIGHATETAVVPDPTVARIVDDSRPTLPDENVDGLDELTAEVIRQAEMAPGEGGPLPELEEEQPVEPAVAVENQAEFPGLADQGEEGPKPKSMAIRKKRKKS
ncbi:MAG: hypothetical protein FJX54_21655 [Alphaproteobacteria bacterium]|nr:hypothetical protein [Alphaproteobacteria bacterium]